jgi:hypothetical protein
MSMLSGGGEAEARGGGEDSQSGAGDSDGVLGSTTSILRGSMKSMGIGKKDDESSLSVGRVR